MKTIKDFINKIEKHNSALDFINNEYNDIERRDKKESKVFI